MRLKLVFKIIYIGHSPRVNLEIIWEMRHHQIYMPKIANICLKSIYSHLWHFHPISSSLLDKEVNPEEKKIDLNGFMRKYEFQ